MSLNLSKNLFVLVVAILQSRTVCLYKLRTQVSGALDNENNKSKLDAHYKRLTRFFCKYSCQKTWLKILGIAFTYLPVCPTKILYLDGTEWSIGELNLHILVLAIDFKGVAIPLYFQVYKHKGVLSQEERMAFMEKALTSIDLKDYRIVADREFIGDNWLVKLADLGLIFVIRLREGQYKKMLRGNQSYHSVKQRAKRKGKASATIGLNGHTFRLWIVVNANENEKEPFIYLLTNELEHRNISNFYRLRWKIETCFKHLKTNGFNLEDLRMKDLEKIRLLFSILTLVYIQAVLSGVINEENEYVGRKKYKNQTNYDAISKFRLGYDILQAKIKIIKQLLILMRDRQKPKAKIEIKIIIENVQ